MQTPELSRRTQRRERTWNLLHDCAVKLVHDKGVKATMTDEIAAGAGVSPRTFFNYFETKEDAILGLTEPTLTAEILEKDTARQQLFIFERVTHLALDLLRSGTKPGSLAFIREMVNAHPELLPRLKAWQLSSEQVLHDFLITIDWQAFIAAGRVGAFPLLPEGEEVPEGTETHVRAAVLLTSAVMRHLEFHKADFDPATFDQCIAESVRVFRDIMLDH